MKKIYLKLVLFIGFFVLFPGIHTAEAFGNIPNGSSIANISLEGMSLKDAKAVLETSVQDWQSLPPLVAESEYEAAEIPRNLFEFHIDASLNNLEERTKREWSNFFIKPKNIQIPIQVTLKTDYKKVLNWSESIDIDKTLDHALVLASNLTEGKIVLEYDESVTVEQTEIAEVTLSLPDISIAITNRLADSMNEKVIKGKDSFSFLDELELPKSLGNSELEMSFVASALYELALQTELEIIERHQAESLPGFTEPGLEAMISRKDEKNLLIHNPANEAYTIHAEVRNNQLVMSILSKEMKTAYVYIKEAIKEIEPRTIYRYSSEMLPGQESVVSAGQSGMQLEIHRNKEAGRKEEKEFISRDFYPPKHRVVLTSPLKEEVTANQSAAAESAEEVNQFITDQVDEDLGKKLNAITACEGNPDCESESDITELDKMFAACLIGSAATDAENAAGEENAFCNFLFLMMILSLFEVSESDEDLLTDESNLIETISEYDDLLEEEEVYEEVVK